MPELAINGGPRTIPEGLSPKWPVFDQTDERALLRVFRSGKWWRGGTIEQQAEGECGKFERAFADYHGSKYGLVCSNGTVAVELALRAAGVSAGDEVVVPALSFVVSASAVLPLGAVPVFVDSDPRTLQPDPAAIVIVHFGGYPADLDRIVRIARKHKLALVEDCAHAQGSQWKGRGVGTYGDYGTFSFQQFKGLTCGEGGLVLCRTKGHWHRAYRYHNLGRIEDKGFYDFHVMSSNLRLTDLQGALLNTQFAKLKRQLPRKMKAAEYLSSKLRELGGLEPLPDDSRITRRGFYYYLLQYEAEAFEGVPREVFRQALAAEGVTMGRGYGQAIYQYPLFQNWENPRVHRKAQYRKTHCPVAENATASTICTLAHPMLLLGRRELKKVVDAVAKVKENAEELHEVGAGVRSGGR